MSYTEQMAKHFGELDEYMSEKLRAVMDARRDKNFILLDSVVAQVRADGYPQFADRLAELDNEGL